MHEMAVVLMIMSRHDIRRITNDSSFYGDCRSKWHTTERAETTVVAFKRAGRGAKIGAVPSPQER